MPTLPFGYQSTVAAALAEDVGTGDITTEVTVPAGLKATGRFVSRAPGIVAGLPLVAEVYRTLDPSLVVTCSLEDGANCEPGDVLCEVTGAARAILTGERVALNFVQHLSGIATRTAMFVSLTTGYKARIVDTRKTTPGLRSLEKYAVRAGGGFNHRSGLYDAILIKDNHILACGSITAAVQLALAEAPHTLSITVECDSLEQVAEALEAGAGTILLDNMTPDQIAIAVEQIDGGAYVEASGGITESTARAVAAAGADIISVGALTHSSPALDIGLDLVPLSS